MSQEFKLSDDQNTLIVVSGQFEGQYEATGQNGCASCSFWMNEVCELKTFSTCAWGFRKDSESIIWMKVKPKQDDKKATAIFSDDKNSLTIKSGKFEGEYQAKKDDNACVDCAFDHSFGCSIGGMLNAHCSPQTRKDGKSIIWQKVEPKQDDKKAVAVFSDNETVLKISGHSEHDGTYEAKQSFDCRICFFGKSEDRNKCGYSRKILGNQKCNSGSRQDKKSIIWIKKETKMTKAPAPAPAPAPALQHRHFDLIVQWAKNPTQPVWTWNVNEWQKAEYLMWAMKHYVIGEKPTEPPVKMVKYDGGSIEFPEPARVELEHNKQYWAATIYGADPDYWTGHSTDIELLENGLIQLTKEGAEKQSEALVELLKNHAQKWG